MAAVLTAAPRRRE